MRLKAHQIVFPNCGDRDQSWKGQTARSVGPNFGVDRTMGFNPKVRTNFGVENFQPHSSVRYPRLCTIVPNFGVEHQSSYELWG